MRRIGAAISEYQTKIEVAYAEHKLEKAFTTHRAAGEPMDRQRGTVSEPTIVNGKVKFGLKTCRKLSPAQNSPFNTPLINLGYPHFGV
jgi:hypothetical protein